MGHRRLSKRQLDSVCELMQDNSSASPFQWTLVGLRECDGALLALYRDKDIREGWIIQHGGLTVRPDPADTDPAAFYR